MKRTTAQNSASGLHVDRVAGVSAGTIDIAEDRNNLQEEIAHPITLLGVALDGTDQYQLEKAIIGLSKPVGEVYEMATDNTPVAWASARNNGNTSGPQYAPFVKLWDADHVLDVANYPLLVAKLRAEKTKTWSGSAYVTDHSVTVSGSTVTGSGAAWDNLLAALAEEELVHGSFTSWRCINIAGTDYAISAVTPASHTLGVTGSPSSGAQTAILYGHRIAGAATTCRTYKDSGRATMSPDGTLRVAGLRRRHHIVGHFHEPLSPATGIWQVRTGTGGVDGVSGAAQGYTSTGGPITDGTYTPIIGPEVEPNSSTVYRVMHAGVLL
jgi:hypothetical protein